MGLVEGGPLFPHLVLDGQVHVAPAVMDPELQGLALELDGAVVSAAELEHVGDPVDHAEGALEMDLDHVPLRLVMDLIVDLMGHPQPLSQPGGVVFHSHVFHRVGDPPGVGIILAGVDEILLKGEPPILHPLSSPVLPERPFCPFLYHIRRIL